MTSSGFCAWYPLADVARCAPAAPGVYQVRLARGLIAYPTGKSAMIHYAYADDLQRDAGRWAHAHRDRASDWLCRHITGPAPAMAEEHRALRSRFERRFGAPPAVPAP